MINLACFYVECKTKDLEFKKNVLRFASGQLLYLHMEIKALNIGTYMIDVEKIKTFVCTFC